VQVSFLYGSDHQRIREVSSKTVGGITTQKTLAVLHPDNAGALYFERETINTGTGAGTAENRHYLTAEKGAFLLITSSTSLQANPTATTLANAQQRYWHKDHLGSIVASTVSTPTATVGMAIERMAYEPFGKRRFTTGQFDQTGTIDATSTTRGFTGHEHLDSLDFIHMNARVYDPDIGRFLSPDPTVPYVHNPQSFNRYSYTQNNPLNRVDPDGFKDVDQWTALHAPAAEVIAMAKAPPDATTPAHEAKTAANPGQGYATFKDAPMAQALLDAFRGLVEYGGTPAATAKGVAVGAMAWSASHASSIKGSLAAAWSAAKSKLGFGAKGGGDYG
jgi:RHS repeat-associated protein